jgi:surface-anchored protein
MIRHRTRIRLTASAAAAVATVALAAAPAAAGTRPVVISQGHVDVLDIAYEEGELEMSVHDEDGEHDPDDVLLVALPESRTTVPDDPAYGFLGDAGDPVWVLPEVADPDLLFPGLSAEEIEAGVFAGDAIRLRLVRVAGPGEVAVFRSDEFGAPEVVFDSGDGLPDRTDLSVATHVHQSWAFERPGTYRLTFVASGRLAADGARVGSDLVTVAFEVRR